VLLWGESALMRFFSSAGFIQSPISATTFSRSCYTLVQPIYFSIYVTLCVDIVAGSDGKRIHDRETEPADVESLSLIIYPACVTIAGLVTS